MRSGRVQLLLVAVALSLYVAPLLAVAIARGTVTQLGTGASPYSIVVASDDTFLSVCISGPASGGSSPTLVQYNGVTLTQRGTVDVERVRWWYTLVGPDTGTHDLTVTWSGSVDYNSLVSATYKGTITGIGTPVSNTDFDGEVAGTVTVGASSNWLVGCGVVTFGNTPTAGANTSVFGLSGDNYMGMVDSNGTVATGSRSLNVGGSTIPGIMMAELQAGGGGGGGHPNGTGGISLLGVGR